MKEQQEEKFKAGDKYAVSIQHVNARPFAVFSFSRKQFDVLASEKMAKGELDGLFDASGGLVRKPKNIKKRILYYPFSIPISAEDGHEKNCRVFPFAQMVGGAHDQTYIGIFLKVLKREFCKVYPHLWPIITYATTDFSLASIISISVDWNCRSKIIYKSYMIIYQI